MRQSSLPALARFFSSLSGYLSNRIEGYEVPFMEEVLRQHGIAGATRILPRLGKLVTKLEHQFGEVDAHMVIGMASLRNGCRFCGQGHMLAADLAYFAVTGSPHPLDPRRVPTWIEMTDAERIVDVERALRDNEYAKLSKLLRRMHELTEQPPSYAPADPTEASLLAALAAYEWLTWCSIGYGDDDAKAIPPLSRRAKDKHLRTRYAELRPV